MTLLWSVFQQTLHSFVKRPFAFVLVQWPLVVLIFVGELITPKEVSRMTDLIVPLLIYLPTMVACLCLATSGSWHVFHETPVQQAVLQAFRDLGKLFLPYFFAVIWIVVGLPIILPGIYFSALFLFVPYLVLLEPGAKPFSYLHRSRLLASKRLGLSLFIATGILVLDLAQLFVGGAMSLQISAATGFAAAGHLCDALLAGIVGAGVNIGVIHYFNRLREAS